MLPLEHMRNLASLWFKAKLTGDASFDVQPYESEYFALAKEQGKCLCYMLCYREPPMGR